jgi:hypothetical protein
MPRKNYNPEDTKAFVTNDEKFGLEHKCRICENPELTPVVDKLLDANVTYREIKKVIKEEFDINLALQEISFHNHHRKVDYIKNALQEIEVDLEELKNLPRSEALKRERIENQILAVKVRKILDELLTTGRWAEIRPDYIKALTELYDVSTSETRLATSEEFKQLQNEETDLMKELMRAIKELNEGE